MALLAAYLGEKIAGQTLEDYMENRVFAGQNAVTLPPDPAARTGFNAFMKKYENGLVVERTAVQVV